MATKNFNARISLKYDSYANWIANDPVLLVGEVAIATIPTKKDGIEQVPAVVMKVGDGTKKYSELQFVSGLAADIYDWAKAATKPSYSANEITGLSDYISGQIQDTNTQYQIVVDAENPRKFQLQSHEKGVAEWTNVGNPITIPASVLETGTTNGTVKFNGAEVAVAGLKSAAYTESTAYDEAGAAAAVLGKAADDSTKATVYGARALVEAFYLEDFAEIEREFPNFHFHLALDRPDPAADAAGVKYVAGFVHNVMYETYLKNHDAPEDIKYFMCGPPMMVNAVVGLLDSLGVQPESILYDNFGA